MNTGRIVALTAGAAAIVAGVLSFRTRWHTPVSRVTEDVAAVAQGLTDETDSLSEGALYQRHQAVRDAIQTMRADLLRLVAAESAFTADSGRPTVYPQPPYWSGPSPGVVGPSIRLTRDGWWANVTHTRAAIECAIVVGPDTTIGNAPPGQVACSSKGF